MAPACQELAPGAELETLTVNGSSREKSKSSRLVSALAAMASSLLALISILIGR